jgi:hypothetical protein
MNIRFSSKRKPSSPRALAIVGLISLVMSVGFQVAAAITAFNVDRFLNEAEQATGTIVALSEKHETERNSINYAPVFTFKTEYGRTQSITSRVATNPPSFAVGDRVHVLYRRSDPAGAQIDSFWQLWFWPVFLAAFGSVELLVGITFLYIARRKLHKRAVLLSTGL